MTNHSAQTLLDATTAAIGAGGIRVVDLTHLLSPDFPTITLPPQFGQSAPFRSETISRYDENGPAWYWSNFSCGEHTGTHFDAPAHWVTGRGLPNATVDLIPPANFVAGCCVLDCSTQAAADPDFLLTIDAVQAWEKQHGTISARSWVLMRTDWGYRQGADYPNLREDGAHTPGPDAAVIDWLIRERDILGFGTETIGTDAGQAHLLTPAYPAHSQLHGNNRYGLQCLTRLDQLPPRGALIVAAPLKMQDGSGSPVRVLALVPGA